MIFSYGTSCPQFAKIAWQSQCVYAQRIGQPYKQILIPPDEFPNRLKLEQLDRHGPKTGTVLYLDWDVIISDDAENVFDLTVPFAMLKYNCKIPWPCSAMLLADISTFRAMIPFFEKHYAANPPDHFREEKAIPAAAIDIGIEPIEISPQGFKHRGGISKWRIEGCEPETPYKILAEKK